MNVHQPDREKKQSGISQNSLHFNWAWDLAKNLGAGDVENFIQPLGELTDLPHYQHYVLIRHSVSPSIWPTCSPATPWPSTSHAFSRPRPISPFLPYSHRLRTIQSLLAAQLMVALKSLVGDEFHRPATHQGHHIYPNSNTSKDTEAEGILSKPRNRICHNSVLAYQERTLRLGVSLTGHAIHGP